MIKVLQFISLGLIVGLLLGGAYYVFSTKYTPTNTNEEPSQTATVLNSVSGIHLEATTTTPVFTWELKSNSQDGTTSSTEVRLTAEGQTHVLGTYSGICTQIAADKTGIFGEYADADELSPRVQCVAAGNGNELGLFKDGTGYIVEIGTLQTDATGATKRGNFTSSIPL